MREVIKGIGIEREAENSTEGGLKEGIVTIKKVVGKCGKEEDVKEKRGQ